MFRTEDRLDPTAAQEVHYEDVLLPDGGSPSDTADTLSATRNLGADSFELSLSGHALPVPAVSIPALDQLLLNKNIAVARTSETVTETIDEVLAAPIEVWEGEVKSVDESAGKMHVYLRSKIGHLPEHTAEISLEWVSDQDIGLVRPGAIFYWSLFKEKRRGSIRNSQELRFRRRPNWSKSQILRIRTESEKLFQNPRAPRVFEDPQG